jgi:hypothetical protein
MNRLNKLCPEVEQARQATLRYLSVTNHGGDVSWHPLYKAMSGLWLWVLFGR